MMGLQEIVKANEDPEAHARLGMSDGQERRAYAPPSNYWSETAGGDRFSEALQAFEEKYPNVAPVAASDGPTTMADAFKRDPDLDRARKGVTYFDAVRMNQSLMLIANDANDAYINFNRKLRALQTANTIPAIRDASAELAKAMQAAVAENSDLAVRMHIEDLASQIDAIAPVPFGYTPRMGLAHAMQPLRNIVNRIKACWANSDG